MLFCILLVVYVLVRVLESVSAYTARCVSFTRRGWLMLIGATTQSCCDWFFGGEGDAAVAAVFVVLYLR